MGYVVKSERLETAVWAGKLLLLCVGLVGIVSTMVFCKVVLIPYLLNLTLSTLPYIWTSLKSYCLSPLYIYIILNFIIIIIVASSIFQNRNQNKNQRHPSSSLPSSNSYTSINNLSHAKTTSTDHVGEFYTVIDGEEEHNKIRSSSNVSENVTISPISSLLAHQFSNEVIGWHDIHIVQHANSTQEEEPIVTVSHTTKASPEEEHSSGEAEDEYSFSREDTSSLEEKPTIEDEDNTLDTTWNAIMERQGKPICKTLKKSDTWATPPRAAAGLVRSSIIPARKLIVEDELNHDHHHHHHNINNNVNDYVVDDRVAWARKELKKAETFNDRVTMIREKSMTQEELKLRAEAFINKINNQMRLQRLESDQRFRDMVNRGHR